MVSSLEIPYPSFEFETQVQKGGTLVLPRSALAVLPEGTYLTVRITTGRVPGSLRARHITEEDVEHIAAIQLERREAVLRFLKAEGALAGTSASVRRARKRNRRRT
jgi:hypothetical protein